MAKATQRPKSARREFIESVVWAVVIAVTIRTFIVAPFKIPSGSMRPTLIEGDRILVSKFIYRFREPQRGDIIVFRYPDDRKRPFIKRVVALGSEAVEISDGHVMVNDEPVTEVPFIESNRYVNRGSYGQAGQTVEVPPGQFFVLGDHSAFSHDSRFWGFVPRELLIGRAVCIFWPPNRIRILQ